MIKMQLCAAGVLAGAVFVTAARAQVADDAAGALKDSAKAIQDLKGVSYKSRFYGTGALEKFLNGHGEVKMIRDLKSDSKHAPIWIKGDLLDPAKQKLDQMTVSYDGEWIWWLDDPANKLFQRRYTERTDASRNLDQAQKVALLELAEAAPFAKDLKADKVVLSGTDKVHGELCKVVTASWTNPERTGTWYIGVTDNLPRKVERTFSGLTQGIEIWDVKMEPSLKPADMAIALPKGYVLDKQDAPAPVVNQNPQQSPNMPVPPAPELGIKAGSMAPDFDLKASDGKAVKLGAMRGNVVVLSFFGTMFTKSDDVNTAVQEVQDAMKDKVKAVGLACREDADKTVTDYAKDKKYTFTMVPKADTVVDPYHVVGFPSVYVINSEGKVAAFFQGGVTKEQLMKAVQDADKPAAEKTAPEKTAPAKPVEKPAGVK